MYGVAVCFVGDCTVVSVVYGVAVCVLLGVMLYWVPCWDEDQCMVSLCVFCWVLCCTGYPAGMKISVWCHCVCFVWCYTVLGTLLG